ncbi:MAG: hypothetical protein ACO3VI_03290 [Ilumatobacteraceae bacterium]
MVDSGRDRGGITLHSSWWGIVSGVISSSVLCALGAWAVASVGFKAVPTVILILGVALAVVVFFDLPLASRIDEIGVERRALLRRHRLGWERVRAVSRGRPAVSIRKRSLDPGPLVAVVGRRRYMVIDQTESLEEYQRIIEILRGLGRDDDAELLLPPPEQRPPTWTYRRSHWQGR